MSNFLYFLEAILDNIFLFNFLIVWKILKRTKRFFRNLKLKFQQRFINDTFSIKFLIFLPTLIFIASVEKWSVKILSSSLIQLRQF